jgi:hypothetical protein
MNDKVDVAASMRIVVSCANEVHLRLAQVQALTMRAFSETEEARKGTVAEMREHLRHAGISIATAKAEIGKCKGHSDAIDILDNSIDDIAQEVAAAELKLPGLESPGGKMPFQ